MKWRLALANFFQVFPFCLVLIHGIFLRSGPHNEYQWAVVFSMGLYSALQIGGVWLISWIPRKILAETYFWNSLRIMGGLLYLIDNSFFIIIGAGLIGLAQALFYRYSRQMVSTYWKDSQVELDHVYTIMALSLNVSFLILPLAGSELIKYFTTPTLMISAIIFSIFGVSLINGGKQYLNDDNEVKTVSDYVLLPAPSLKNVFADLFFLGSFVIPYGIMMALIPLKTKAEGMGIETNGKLFGLNAFVVICILIIKSSFAKKSLAKLDLTKNLKLMSILAWILVILSGLAPLKWLIVAFILWSLLEALQLPTIERHIFSKRSYSPEWVDRILVVDAVGSFAAPLLASLIISLQGGIS